MTNKKQREEITPEMTATAIMLQRNATQQIKMVGKVCEALLSGKIDSTVIIFAEKYLHVNKELLKNE